MDSETLAKDLLLKLQECYSKNPGAVEAELQGFDWKDHLYPNTKVLKTLTQWIEIQINKNPEKTKDDTHENQTN